MEAWNRRDVRSLGRWLGMVPVPGFSRTRTGRPALNDHYVLLDGERSSFFLSFGNASDLLDLDGPVSWAWSSNVTYSVILDESADSLVYRRWDEPSNIREEKSPNEETLKRVLRHFDASTPPTEPSVIDRSMEVFRIVRQGVEDMQGTASDVMTAYTTLLSWASRVRDTVAPQNELESVTLIDAAAQIGVSLPETVSKQVHRFPIGEFVIPLLKGEQTGEYLLDSDLLVRHASGTLFQEAHVHLVSQPQKKLFVFPAKRAPAPSGEAKRDAYFTPPALARALIEQSLAELHRLNRSTQSFTVLDPACGSGVFLLEAFRETRGRDVSLSLHGIDNSEVACQMTAYTLQRTIGDEEIATDVQIVHDDSLNRESWGDPDIIVMNPPFTSWGDMDEQERESVRSSLGELYFGRADKSAAFIAKAVRNLKPGAVMASLVPQSFLTSRFAERLRNYLMRREDLNIRLIGQITGFSFFHGATVEPAFVVLSRSHSPAPSETKRIIATDAEADRAIRALRLDAWGESRAVINAIHEVTESALDESTWRPRRAIQTTLRNRLEDNRIPVLATLFRVYEGIRTGNNDVFVLSSAQMTELGIPRDQPAFRPAATNSTIRVGRLIPSKFVFYPYTEAGKPMFASEASLREAVPTFFDEVLAPNRKSLERRPGLTGSWWSLIRRRSWQAPIRPRLVSTVFGDTGSFTFDATGRFAIVQGFYWEWRNSNDQFTGSELALAYVALLNSTVFTSVCRIETRTMQGGQMDLYPNHIKNVHLPDLSKVPSRVTTRLAEFGDAIVRSSSFPDLNRLDELVAVCYQVPLQDIGDATPKDESPGMAFGRLSREWHRDTAHLSSPKHIVAHPAYQQIIRLGDDIVPLIAEKLKTNPNNWFYALADLTGVNPVSEGSRGNVPKMVEDWLSWLARR